MLGHNLFNWCHSWGPYAESPENAHTDGRARLLIWGEGGQLKRPKCGATTCWCSLGGQNLTVKARTGGVDHVLLPCLFRNM